MERALQRNKILICFLKSLLCTTVIFFAITVYDFAVCNQGSLKGFKLDSVGPLKISLICVLLFILMLFFYDKKNFKDYLFQYRFLIAGILFIMCVAMGITGSSIGRWCDLMGSEENGVLLGISRWIRSDEYAVLTPMGWSQYYDANGAFSYFSSVVRGCKTDVFLEYGQPVATWLMVYRPFCVGYLFLPIANGMAFFWCGRFIALFMTSFEFGRLITDDKRLISVVYAFLITFSPVVQWWFAINGLVEMLIYIQLSVLAMKAFMLSKSSVKRFFLMLLIVICAGGYILTLYPAWQVSLAYVLLVLILWTFLENKEQCKMKKRDWLFIAFGIVILAASMGYVWHMSKDTILSIMNTVYPGSRCETGGGAIDTLFNYACSIWLTITGETPDTTNTCEMAHFIDLFPMCYIVWFIVRIKTKNKDFLSTGLMTISAILGIYCVWGIPKLLAKITLLSNCQANRTLVAFTFCNVIILIRNIAKMSSVQISFKFKRTVVVCGLSLLPVWCVYKINPDYYSVGMVITMLIVFLSVFAFSIYVCKKQILIAWSCILLLVSLIAGGLVNPIRKGIKDIQAIPELQMIRNVVEQDGTGLWVVEGQYFPIMNLGLMAGAPTINSTNVYPNLERWAMLDGGQNEAVYNRYAHITVFLEDVVNAKFEEGVSADTFTVTLSLNDLKKMGVKYMLSASDFDNNYIKLIASCGAYKVYELQ